MHLYLIHLPDVICFSLVPLFSLIFSKRPWHATSNPGKSSLLGKGFLLWDSCSCHHRKCPVDWKISFSFFYFLPHTIFIHMLSFWCNSYFSYYFPSILTRNYRTPQNFWWGTKDLVRFSLWLVNVVKNAWQAISLMFVFSY